MIVHLESLYHFRCDYQPEHFWSIADIKPLVGQQMYCPFCGKQSMVEGIETHPLPIPIDPRELSEISARLVLRSLDEMDAFVAEYIMNFKPSPGEKKEPPRYSSEGNFIYVVRRIMDEAFSYSVGQSHESEPWCSFRMSDGQVITRTGPTMAIAVCLAALQFKGIQSFRGFWIDYEPQPQSSLPTHTAPDVNFIQI